MTASELIAALAEQIATHGDLPIVGDEVTYPCAGYNDSTYPGEVGAVSYDAGEIVLHWHRS